MSKIVWDATGERLYETGVDRGVLYPFKNNAYQAGVPWNGLTAVNENPSGAEPTALWADNIKYLNLLSAEEFGCTIECYTYPDEFEECDGSKEIAVGVSAGQQTRIPFGFSYRSLIGNDTEQTSHGYKIHLVYNCLASPSERNRNTVNDTPEAMNPSFEVSTTPIEVPGMKPTAHIVINSTKVDAAKLTTLEDMLYGAQNADPTFPTIQQLITIFGNGNTNGNG